MSDAVGVHVMPYTCRGCSRTFSEKLDRDLHTERCVENTLQCRRCGETFDERRATTDGWRFECPECDAAGIGDGLRRLDDRPLATARD